MASDYTLGNPTLDVEISTTGSGFQKVWEVPYTVTDGPAAGIKGYIRVPAEQYNADIVHAAIRDVVDNHHEVMSR